MHVLLLSNEYPPFIFGGIGTFAKGLAQSLSKTGVRVTVVTGYPSNSLPLNGIWGVNSFGKVEDGVSVIRFPYPDIPPRHTMFQVANLSRLRKIIEEISPDVIHGQSGSTYPTCRFLKDLAPLLVTFHTSPQVEKTLVTNSLLRGGSRSDFLTYLLGYPAWSFTFKKELQYSTTAVAVSRALKSDLVNEMGEAFDKKILCVHNGVDLETLDREFESDPGLEESDDKILFAGRLFWRKGALNLIKMAYLLQKNKTKFKIIVHGTGPLFSRMQKDIELLGLRNIELKGFTTKQQLMKSFRLCRFVVIPSMYEACPMILLESMCLGKIPLMLRLPFSSELTEGGRYGVLADGIENLTNELMTIKATKSSDQLGKNIRKFARNDYNMENVTAKYIEMYRDISSR
jgi:glycosyltransferase involved in cell wall biosynthesis